MADMECLNNENHLESDLSNEAQLTSEMEKVVEVVKKYIGSETDDIKISVDNEKYVISATFTKKAIENMGKVDDILVNDNSVLGEDKIARISIPTKLSEFTNDKEFIDNTVNNLVNYYTKSETYNKTEVLELVGQIPKFSVQIVPTLPTENISNTVIYLVAVHDVDENNYYEEYIYINNGWEMIGTTKIDLSEYVTLNTDQKVTGTKTFNKINIIGENLNPVYENTETIVNYEYNVEKFPEDNQYEFVLNNSGYYESTNKLIGASNSYAMCKVSFTMYEQSDLVIELINFAESSFDFGIFSKLDKELYPSHAEDIDTTVVYKSFKGIQSALPTTLTYSQVPVGEHFITIKYIKDASSDRDNDSLQFKILSPVGEVVIVESELVGYEDFIAPIDVDEDRDLTFNGEKLVRQHNLDAVMAVLGKLPTFRGVYSRTEQYYKGDIVQDTYGMYVAKKDNIGTPPTGAFTFDNEYWRQLGLSAGSIFISGEGNTNKNYILGVQGRGNHSSTPTHSSNGVYMIGDELYSNNSPVSTKSEVTQEITKAVDEIPKMLSKVATSGSYDDLEDKIQPSAKDNLGTIRAWVDEDGYLCFSTEPLAYSNKQKGDTIYVNGSMNTILSENILTIN